MLLSEIFLSWDLLYQRRLRKLSQTQLSISQSQSSPQTTDISEGGWVVRRCWVNFQCRGVLLIWIRMGQGPTVLAVGASGDFLDIFTLIYHFSFLSPSLWETARCRLKYCLKGPLSPKQPTNRYLKVNFLVPENLLSHISSLRQKELK